LCFLLNRLSLVKISLTA